MAKYNRVHEHLNLKSVDVIEVEHSLAMNALTILTASRIPWSIAAVVCLSESLPDAFGLGMH